MLLQFFYAWAWNSSDVLRPAFRAGLGLSLAQVGAGYSTQVVGALAGSMVVVSFEHLVGRRHTVALICSGVGVSLVAGALVTSWGAFLFQRFAVGFFSGAVFPLTVGLIVELFESRLRGKLASLIDGTYFGAVIVLGLAAGQMGIGGWRALLLFGGLPPVLFAVFAYRFIPEYADHGSAARKQDPRPSLTQLFTPALRGRTIALSTMMGANACGSQAFSGWLTTYLYEVAHLNSPDVGAIIACQFAGGVTGCLSWGWAIDRYGRRAGAFGLAIAALSVIAFLLSPPTPLLLGALAAIFGIAFSAVVSIGPWLAELYPAELRTAATSMFQWGRFISLLAPLATAGIAAHWGLASAMALSVIAFSLAAAIWSRLPETLERGSATKPR